MSENAVWDVIHTIESATKKDDVSNLDRRVLEGLLLDVYAKLIAIVL
jgi:hypothetical protein